MNPEEAPQRQLSNAICRKLRLSPPLKVAPPLRKYVKRRSLNSELYSTVQQEQQQQFICIAIHSGFHLRVENQLAK